LDGLPRLILGQELEKLMKILSLNLHKILPA
jgi:hypothetical protein